MKNRKCRQKVKQFLKHSTPTSSVLNHIATNYKEYYLKFIHRHKFLSQSFAALKHIHKAKKRICTLETGLHNTITKLIKYIIKQK